MVMRTVQHKSRHEDPNVSTVNFRHLIFNYRNANKIVLRFHHSPERAPKNQQNNRQQMLGKYNHCWLGLWTGLSTLEISVESPQKIVLVLPEDPVIPLLSMYPKDAPTWNKDICSTMFLAVLLILARIWKESRCPSTEQWIQKMWYI